MSRRNLSLYVILVILFVAVTIVDGFQLQSSFQPSNSQNDDDTTIKPSNSQNDENATVKPSISVKQRNLNPQLSPDSNYGEWDDDDDDDEDEYDGPEVNPVPRARGGAPLNQGSSSS